MKRNLLPVLSFALFLLILSACAQGQSEAQPPEIRYGETICEQCKMIISDERFAAGYAREVSPGRFESIPFDDIGDMLAYADAHPEDTVVDWYVHDYNTKEWLDAAQAHYVFSNNLQTPMGQGTAAFADKAAAEALAAEIDGVVMDWQGLRQRFEAGELVVHAGRQAGEDGAAMQADAMPAAETILGATEVEGYRLELVSQAPLHAGYNEVMVRFNTAGGEAVSGAEISFKPVMTMNDGMSHGAAVEQPVMDMPGMYRGAVAFPMPSGPDLGNWTLTVAFTDPDTGAGGEATFDIEVAPSKLIGSFVAPDESKLFLMVVQPITPAVGAQPFEIFAMQKASATEWPPVNDLDLEITPWMPTMDHGSPHNENPVFTEAGHYLGKINFSMVGPWTVTVAASRAGEALGDVIFEYDVP